MDERFEIFAALVGGVGLFLMTLRTWPLETVLVVLLAGLFVMFGLLGHILWLLAGEIRAALAGRE